MKIRNGFVSNSGSSNFLMIGISHWDNEFAVNTIMGKYGISESGYYNLIDNDKYGIYTIDKDINLKLYGGNDYPYYAGFDAEGLLETMTLPQARNYVWNRFHELGIDVKADDIELAYGEVGDG